VPALLVFDERHALSFHRPGEHRRRLGRAASALERVVDLGEVVSVDDDRVDAERADARRVRAHVPLELGGPALAEPIHVDDGGEIRETFVTGVVERFPDRALGRLAVSDEDPHVIRRLEHPLSGEGDADADRQALSERAGRDVHPREDGRGMPLQAASELAEGHELIVVDRAGRLEHRVDKGRRVAFREDEVIVRGVVGLAKVVAQMPGEEDRDEVGGRER